MCVPGTRQGPGTSKQDQELLLETCMFSPAEGLSRTRRTLERAQKGAGTEPRGKWAVLIL